MAEKVTLDTDVLFYMVDDRDVLKQQIATEVVAAATIARALLTVVSLGEFYASASRKLKLPKSAITQHMRDFSELFDIVSYDAEDLLSAARENEAGRFEFWDAVMLSAAERAGCTVCLSEDMADGAKLGTITVRNPFGARGLTEAARAALGS